MTVDNISSPISTKECCQIRQGSNLQTPGQQSDMRRLFNDAYYITFFQIFSIKSHVVGTDDLNCFDLLKQFKWVPTTLLSHCSFLWLFIPHPSQNRNQLNTLAWTQICHAFENSVDPDKLASEEANWSGSALFIIQYVNLYQKSGLSNMIGWH